ncbi:MAG: hypothetical protein A3B79_05545 [Deltaproteobacteria bacterium RIFCSPHIGHO2_02_FULL_50_15]|nr:MAG: hypothetical protein A3B79_05545 [Deltaproteobacteria bacterium RIFCSPHIGHO2_02_FULL_50_15]
MVQKDLNTGAMEHIWKTVAKTDKDGQEFIHYTGIAELNFLYFTGFVDTRKYTLEEWQKAFLDARLPNGTYKVKKEQWMAKKHFRYNGPVDKPFKPLEDLEEREYAEAEITNILKNKIIPSTSVDEKTILGYIGHYKSRGLIVDGRMKMDKTTKRDIHNLLEMYPSPLRVLQVNVQKVREQQASGKVEKDEGDKAQLTTSQFIAHQQQDRIAAAQLSSLLKTGAAPSRPQAARPQAPQPAPDKGLSLKDLQRARTRTHKI